MRDAVGRRNLGEEEERKREKWPTFFAKRGSLHIYTFIYCVAAAAAQQ